MQQSGPCHCSAATAWRAAGPWSACGVLRQQIATQAQGQSQNAGQPCRGLAWGSGRGTQEAAVRRQVRAVVGSAEPAAGETAARAPGEARQPAAPQLGGGGSNPASSTGQQGGAEGEGEEGGQHMTALVSKSG